MIPSSSPTLSKLAEALASGETTSTALVEDCLARIEASGSQGKTAFRTVNAEQARAAARAMDDLRKAGAPLSPWAGIPISIKDLFDVRGEVTAAASPLLANNAPATSDALSVARLRQVGFVFIGRANMSEFAYSAMGLNPHFGTPLSAWDRETGRAPGGSTSGGAVSVADGMAHATLGSDTGGSCRIPAAFNGITGYKPTQRRIPLKGAYPLSTTLDSIGPLARSVQCCATLDSLLAGETPLPIVAAQARRVRLAVPRGMLTEGMDEPIASAFDGTLSRLSSAGFAISDLSVPAFDRIPEMNALGGFTAPESYAHHKTLIESKGNAYDPNVYARIMRGKNQSAVDYIALIKHRASLMDDVSRELDGFDAFVLPTSAILPPKLDDLKTPESFSHFNLLALRNTSVVNTIDGCSIALPMSAPGEAPASLMLSATGGNDARLFAIAAAVEAAIRS